MITHKVNNFMIKVSEGLRMKNKYQKKNRESKKSIVLLGGMIVLAILILVGSSYAVLQMTLTGKKKVEMTAGTLAIDYKEGNAIALENAYPMSDANGKILSDENQYFDFTVKSTIVGKAKAIYEIGAEKMVSSTLENNEVKLYLEKKVNTSYKEEMAPKVFTPLSKSTEIGTPAGVMLLSTDSVSSTVSTSYRLRMWVDEKAKLDTQVKTFAVQVIVNAKVDTK